MLSALLAPSYGGCLRCCGSWKWTKEHSTRFSPRDGCFPLCERCWQELGTPSARLPFYRQMFDSWLREGATSDEWANIERAVLEEK